VITKVKQHPVVEESKFLGKVGTHISLFHNLGDYLMKLFMIKDAEEMSADAK
jgi:hypothetical protein